MLRPDQRTIVEHPAKVKVVCMGRRWGKTMMAGVLTAEAAKCGAHVAWVAPTYANSRPLWRFLEMASAQVPKVTLKRVDREMVIDGAGRAGIYTADNPVAMRGEDFDIVICDEAAQYSPEVWSDVIMPTLADRDGTAFLISTPKGKNWFYEEYMRGRADGSEQAAFNAPSAANPLPNIQKAARLARERVSERTYRQEWLAEFVQDGALFVNVEACATAVPTSPQPGRHYVIGVDWARSAGGDYTVFAVMDAQERSMAHLVRLSGQAFDVQLDRLRELWQNYNQAHIVAEYNSMGAPLVERLQMEGLPVTGFVTTAASKHTIITGLELAFDRQEIAVLSDPALLVELNAFERKERAGLPSYSAPTGQHDDTVIALALAWHGVDRGGPAVIW